MARPALQMQALPFEVPNLKHVAPQLPLANFGEVLNLPGEFAVQVGWLHPCVQERPILSYFGPFKQGKIAISEPLVSPSTTKVCSPNKLIASQQKSMSEANRYHISTIHHIAERRTRWLTWLCIIITPVARRSGRRSWLQLPSGAPVARVCLLLWCSQKYTVCLGGFPAGGALSVRAPRPRHPASTPLKAPIRTVTSNSHLPNPVNTTLSAQVSV